MSNLQSRLLQDSDEESQENYYKDKDDDRGLSATIKARLLKEFDAFGGIDKWNRKSTLLDKICAKYPETFGSKNNNPKLFKKTKNFAQRFKGYNNKEDRRAAIIRQAEAEEAKQPQQQ